MSEPILFVRRAEVDARRNLEDFIALSRDRLTALVEADQWDRHVWDVSKAFTRKGKPSLTSRLHLVRHGTLVGKGETAVGSPMTESFGTFVRAFLRYHHSAAPMVFERLHARLAALGHIEAAFSSLARVPDICALSADVLTAAVRIAGAGVGDAVRYQRAMTIQSVYTFCREHGFISSPFTWKHGVRKADDVQERIGDAFAERRAEKLPTRKALDVLALAYCEPKGIRDRVFSAVTAICICAPIRIHEVLQLRADCGCDETRRNKNGDTVPAFGLRVLPGKGSAPQVKWLPDVMEELGREAVGRLREIGTAAREIAAWYVANPTRMYLPDAMQHLRDVTYIGTEALGELVGTIRPVQWAKANDLSPVQLTAGTGFSYRFADLERAVVAQLPKDFPQHNGHANQPYSESLILVRRGCLRADTVGEGSRVMFEPLGINAYGMWLSGATDRPSVFERYGFTEADGSAIEQTSHGFRHWLNDTAHREGLGAMDIAHWSGRDPSQNKHYDHQTPAQFHDQWRDLVEKARGIGPVFEAADALPDTSPISRADFLRSHLGAAHQTELGACIHDYSLLPCQKHGDCLNCEENVFIKGDPVHRGEISRRHDLTAAQLAAAREAMDEGDYGADLWVQDHEASLGKLALMLSTHGDASIPDGKVVNLPGAGADTEVSLAIRQRDGRAA